MSDVTSRVQGIFQRIGLPTDSSVNADSTLSAVQQNRTNNLVARFIEEADNIQQLTSNEMFDVVLPEGFKTTGQITDNIC